jgi:hypothetical protein
MADTTTAHKTANPTMFSILSRLLNSSSDELYWKLQLVLSLLVGITFVIGFWTVRVGWRANRRANSELSATNERAKKLENETEGLKGQNIAAQRDLEAEKSKRLEMEKSLAPRGIGTFIDKDGKSNLDPLKEFAGQELSIWYMPQDFESKNAAQYLDFEIRQAGWKVREIRPDPSVDMPGNPVLIEVASGSRRPSNMTPREAQEQNLAEVRIRIAANTLAEYLSNEPNNWNGVRRSWDMTNSLERDALRIKIGPKPMPYFNPPLGFEEPEPTAEEVRLKESQERRDEIQSDRESIEQARQNEAFIEKLRSELGDEEMKRRGLIAPDPTPPASPDQNK